MLGALLIAGAVGALAGAIIAKFWKEIIGWLGKVINKFKEKLGIIVQGSETLLKRVAGGFQESSVNYSKTSAKTWRKDTIIKRETVSESEIPEEIRQQAFSMGLNQMIDITQQTEVQVLSLQNA